MENIVYAIYISKTFYNFTSGLIINIKLFKAIK